MRDLAFFVGGFACCMWFVWAVLKLQDRHERKRARDNVLDMTLISRQGFTYATFSSTANADTEGRDASANTETETVNSQGAGLSARPHLKIVDEEK